ncbi:hypothetical protein ACU8V7_20790 [Zobellia nedashkovskayae]
MNNYIQKETEMLTRNSRISIIVNRTFTVVLGFYLFTTYISAQNSSDIPLPENLVQGYPRLYITNAEKKDLQKTIKKEAWAKNVFRLT